MPDDSPLGNIGIERATNSASRLHGSHSSKSRAPSGPPVPKYSSPSSQSSASDELLAAKAPSFGKLRSLGSSTRRQDFPPSSEPISTKRPPTGSPRTSMVC